MDGYRLAVPYRAARCADPHTRWPDWTHRFPDIAEAARALGAATMIIDGEAVVLDEEGRPDSGCCSSRSALSARDGRKSSSDAILYAFDLIYLDGHDICAGSNTALAAIFLKDTL